jgi:succinyl-CoA synthetase beta subunit
MFHGTYGTNLYMAIPITRAYKISVSQSELLAITRDLTATQVKAKRTPIIYADVNVKSQFHISRRKRVGVTVMYGSARLS